MTSKEPALTSLIGTEPVTVETTVAGLGLDPTPVDALFVRNNLATPSGLGDDWTVDLVGTQVDGRLGLDEIFGDLPRHTLPMVLQCAGNGRGRLPEPAPGVQWDLGGMACVEWSGVRLADLVAAHGGLVEKLPFVTVLGGDASPDDPSRVERSVPAAVALADAVLADRMNGDEIAPDHGGPIRFVMPGFYAVNSVKWVRRVAFTAEESDADIQQVRYRVVPAGTEPGPEHPSVWSMGPMSHIVEMSADGSGIVVRGVAFSGGDPIEAVDLTTDGETWTRADLGPDGGRFAWRRFEGEVAPGGEWVASRCRTAGGTQPRRSIPNQDGYAVDGWQDLAAPVSF